MPRTTTDPKPIQVSIPLTPKLDHQLRERAYVERRSRPAIVRLALERYLEENAA